MHDIRSFLRLRELHLYLESHRGKKVADFITALDKNVVDQVYLLIAQKGDAITMQELDYIVGNSMLVREIVTRLILLGKIRRRKTFLPGVKGIAYVYEDNGKKIRPT